MLILVVGSTGAGKTTYAQKLASDMSAEVFSIDEWMKNLYWQDMPPSPDYQWFVDNTEWYTGRIARCEKLIEHLALERARRHENTILDLGFSTSDHRKRFIEIFESQGFEVAVHYLHISPEIRWERVQKRNQEKGATFAMMVDRQMFDFMESIFEAPTEAEGQIYVIKD